jgi:hypothetical protein
VEDDGELKNLIGGGVDFPRRTREVARGGRWRRCAPGIGEVLILAFPRANEMSEKMCAREGSEMSREYMEVAAKLHRNSELGPSAMAESGEISLQPGGVE